jgi:2-oxoisovalerate dehydrogenase E1 component
VEVRVPRILGHYNADIEHYRTAEDKRIHLERDPLASLRRRLALDPEVGESKLLDVEKSVSSYVMRAAEQAVTSSLPDPQSARDHVTSSAPYATLGALPTSGQEVAYGLAVNQALNVELQNRPEVVCFGEDIAVPGGTFGVTRNLAKRYGDRVFDTPISEAAILGAALGASLEGLRPIVEVMWMDFLFVALDQLVNQAANVRYLARGRQSAPMVVRVQQGVSPGSCAQHSQSLEAVLAHIPGLKVGLPSNAHDAYHMMRAAIADPDPVVLIEGRTMYLSKATLDAEMPVEPVGGARLRRRGTDLAVISWGTMVAHCVAAANQLEREQGISASVLDLRWLSPLDDDAIARVAQESGRVLIVHEANLTGGFGAEVSARIAERHSATLQAPIRRLGVPDTRVPATPVLQSELVPNPHTIAAAMSDLCAVTT